MCGLICVPSPRLKRPFDASCRSYARLRERHRAARERDRDGRGQLEPLGVLAREQQREERIVRPFEGVDAVVAECFEPPRVLGHGVEVGRGRARRRFSPVPLVRDLLRWVDGRLRARNLRRARRRRLRRVVRAAEHAGGVRLLGRARRGWPRARARDRHRAGSRSRSRRAASRCTASTRRRRWSRSCAPSRAATTIPVDVGDMADVPVDGDVRARLHRVQHVLHADVAGRAGAMLPQRRRAPRARRPLRAARVRPRHVAHRARPGPERARGRARSRASRRDRRTTRWRSGSTRPRCASPRTVCASSTPSCGSRSRPSST